ncbi:MAG: hypothetical protein DDT33_01331 [Firmicutes bacterium]|nr:hypothetical protein [Bacillota bacterium]
MDIFCGVGSIFIAMTLGRNVYGIELEKRFANIAALNIQHIREHYDTGETFGTVIQGDTRKVLPLPVHVDCIITSPVYGDTKHKMTRKDQSRMEEILGRGMGEPYNVAEATPGQLGNLSYQMQRWEMDKIYCKCYQQLKSGGILVVVTKDQIKNGKRVEIGLGTIKGCLDAGFILKEKHTRLCQVTGMQRLHINEPGYTPITEEDVLVFKKV